jgi:mannose/fructose-specific phosphotransferase system component IIA
MDLKTTKIKEIAALPHDERRKLLEQAAEHAAPEYETNKELTVFTDRLGVLDFLEE